MVDHKHKPKWHVSKRQRSNARAVRRETTGAPRIICYNAGAQRFQGVTLRRQTPGGPYVVDFGCRAAKLIVELNGGQQREPKTVACDARRDAYLTAQGCGVVRFNSLDVMKNKAGLPEQVAVALAGSQPPSLTLPRGPGRRHGHVCREDVP